MPVSLAADALATCQCGTKLHAVGMPAHHIPPTTAGVKREWWITWNGVPAAAALTAQAAYEQANAETIAKLEAARAMTIARQEAAAYGGDG